MLWSCDSSLAHLYKIKECLCDTPDADPHALTHVLAHGHVRDQNAQFLRLGQFLSNYKV